MHAHKEMKYTGNTIHSRSTLLRHMSTIKAHLHLLRTSEFAVRKTNCNHRILKKQFGRTLLSFKLIAYCIEDHVCHHPVISNTLARNTIMDCRGCIRKIETFLILSILMTWSWKCQKLLGMLSFARYSTLGIGKILIFTIFMVYENQTICQHTSRVGGSWILSGWFQSGALVRIRTFGWKTKHPNASNSDAKVRMRKFGCDLRTFGYEQRTMVSHPNSEIRIKWRWAFRNHNHQYNG